MCNVVIAVRQENRSFAPYTALLCIGGGMGIAVCVEAL